MGPLQVLSRGPSLIRRAGTAFVPAANTRGSAARLRFPARCSAAPASIVVAPDQVPSPHEFETVKVPAWTFTAPENVGLAPARVQVPVPSLFSVPPPTIDPWKTPLAFQAPTLRL